MGSRLSVTRPVIRGRGVVKPATPMSLFVARLIGQLGPLSVPKRVEARDWIVNVLIANIRRDTTCEFASQAADHFGDRRLKEWVEKRLPGVIADYASRQETGG